MQVFAFTIALPTFLAGKTDFMPSLALYINCSSAFPTSCPTVFRCAFACASLPIFSPTKMSEDWDELERTYVTPPFHSFGTKPHCFSGSAFAPSALKVTPDAHTLLIFTPRPCCCKQECYVAEKACHTTIKIRVESRLCSYGSGSPLHVFVTFWACMVILSISMVRKDSLEQRDKSNAYLGVASKRC
ncbi:hypothetical protein JOM56_013994 [Amanita muscaria]